MSVNRNVQDDVVAYEPNSTITEALEGGFEMRQHLTPSRVEACQGIIDEAAKAFFEHGFEDVLALEMLLRETGETTVDDAFFLAVQGHAHNVRGQAQILGFTLITRISGHMIDSIELAQVTDAKKYQLVRRITEVLRLAFTDKIQDAGGPKGMELLALLEAYLASQH